MKAGLAPNRRATTSAYEHGRMERRRGLLRWMIHNIAFRFLIRIESVEGAEHVPLTGPLIAIYNHIAFVDPIVSLANLPRNTVPLAKVEAYDYPLVGLFPRWWEVIPVRRGEVDRRALRSSLAVLEAGEGILMAPEGTRSPALLEAREGVAYLAEKTRAVVVPVALDGTDRFPSLSPRVWRGPAATVRIGRGFRFRKQNRRSDQARLRLMTDEAMFQLAKLLPEARRGHYADLQRGLRNYPGVRVAIWRAKGLRSGTVGWAAGSSGRVRVQ